MNKQYLLSLSALTVLTTPALMLADGTVIGTVRDADSGISLEGVQVLAPGQAVTSTDRSGRYRLDLPAGQQRLRFDYLGADPVYRDVTVTDNQMERINVDLFQDVIELEEFVVHARTIGTARSLNQQRASENLKNIVAADAIGKFPDENAAEALSRMPGVTVERDQGEGRFVIIRGIDPELSSVSLDGIALATPGADERKTLLDTIPTETLAALEVTKAVLPDQPGDSIGGHINLVSPSAYDREGRFVSGSASLLYANLTDEWGYKGSVFYSDLFGNNDEWGLAVSLVWSQRSFGSDNMEAGPWELVEDPASGEEYWAQTDAFEFREYDLTRERLGGSFNLEYRPNDNSQYFVRGGFNEYTDREIRHLSSLQFGEEWEDENEDTDDMTEYTSVSKNAFTAENVPMTRELKDREETMSIYALSIGGQHVVDNLTVDYTLGLSYAEEETPYDFETVFEIIEDAHHTDPTDGDYEAYKVNPDFRVTNTGSYLPTVTALNTAGDIDPFDPDSYEFDGIEDADQKVEEMHYTADFNLRYDFSGTTYIKTGGFLRQKEKESDLKVRQSDDNPGDIDELTGFVNGNVRDPYNTNFPYVTGGIREYFLDNKADFAMESPLEDNVVEDYDINETVYAGYLMGGMTFGKLDIIAGARVEHTEYEADGFAYDDGTETAAPTSFEKDYTNWLPGVHFRYEIRPNLIARASWTNAIARPTFEQASPGQVIDGDEIERGNPELDPYEAMNWDASIEYYFEGLGVISAAVFYKDIDSFIYEQTEDNGTNEITEFRNGDSGDILGLELAYQQQLTFLPFDGLSLLANVTFSDSSADILVGDVEDGSRELPFVKQSEIIGNLALSYEYEGFFIRLSGVYRDDYLDEVGGDADGIEDRYVDSHFQLDLSTSYTFQNDLTIFADFINITNEPFRAYWGESGRLSQFEEYGWSAAFGVKWNM